MPFLIGLVGLFAGGGGLFGGIFGKIFGGLLKSFVSKAFGGGKGGGKVASQSRTLSVKQAISTKKIVYGRAKVSGPIIMFESEGGKKDKEFLHMIVPVAAHEIQAFETVYLDQSPLILDTDGEVLGSGPFVGTWSGSTVTLTNPNSSALTEAEVGDRVVLKRATKLAEGQSSTASIVTAENGSVAISAVELQDLDLEQGDTVSITHKDVTMDANASVGLPSAGWFWFTTNSFTTDELDAGAPVVVKRRVKASGQKTGTIDSIDVDAGTITFTSSLFDEGDQVYATKLANQDLQGTKYPTKVRVKLHFGTAAQSADSEAVEEITGWTEDHKLSGLAYMYIRFKHDNLAFPNGLPNPSAVVLGKRIYDTRTQTTAYSNNPALCIYDYLTDPFLGLGQEWTSADIDLDTIDAAANICDESVTITGGTENRYECNGVVDTAQRPSRIIGEMLSSMGGTLTQVGGMWKLYAGEYVAPTLELDESDVLGPLDIQTRVGRRELFNGVKGVYISEKNFWQESDYPAVSNSTYISADGGAELWRDYNLTYTTSPAMSQRLAKIQLQEIRQPVTVRGVFSPKALQLEPNDSVMITNDQLGWTQKIFLVTGLKWTIVDDSAGLPYLATELELRETASSVYDWNFSADEVIVDTAPNTGLNSIFDVTAPVIASASSGTDQLDVHGDGTISSRILVTWDDPGDQFITVGGFVEVQKKVESSDVWLVGGTVQGDAGSSFIDGVIDGKLYSLRARFINAVGTKSAWSDEFGHRVIGKTEPPDDVTNFIGFQNGALTSFRWDEVTDVDLRGYEIRFGPQGLATWNSATVLVKKKSGNLDTSATIPPGDHVFMIKAVDTSGNYSVTEARYALSITNTYTVDNSLTLDEFAEIATNTNLEVHVTNSLVPLVSESADGSADAFDWSLLTPVGVGIHTLPEVDLGSDKAVRVWSNITSSLLPGVTTGAAQPELQIRYRLDGEAFAASTLENLNILEASGTTFTNCVLHHTGKLVPESQDLGSVDDILDEFVQNAYDEWEFISPEIDLGADTTIDLTISATAVLGVGESGLDNYTIELNTSPDGGPYNGFTAFTGGRINARYFKFKIKSNSSTGKTAISNVTLAANDFQTWTVGSITARYVQAQIIVDPDVGKMVISDYLITIDEET